jgi:subtilisin family serine protease
VRSEEVIDKNTGRIINHEEMAADHLLVNLPPGVNPSNFFNNLGPEVISMSQIMPDSSLYSLNISPSIRSLSEVLEKVTEVSNSFIICEPDMIYHSIDSPYDFVAANHWGLTKISGELSAFTAPSKQNSSPSKLVAIIDTGVRYTHQELGPNMWHNLSATQGDIYGWNAVENNGDPQDDNGHGTFCAGVVGAVGNNNMGIIGVVPVVQLMACKALDKNGNGVVSDAVVCIDYACKNGAKVLNCSWGRGPSEILYQALKNAQLEGVICVAAAGNDGQESEIYPAAYGIDTAEGSKLDNVVSVAASTQEDTLASFSNYEKTAVPIAAPGVDICSSFNNADDGYATGSGTSFSVPYVTGALVLMEAQFPNQPYNVIINKMYNTADHTSGLTDKVIFGRLNITKALAQ